MLPEYKKNNLIKFWLITFGIVTIIGLLNFAIAATSEFAEYNKINLLKPFINEMTGAYAVLILLPVLLFLFSKYPVTKLNFPSRIPVFLFISILFGVSHTLMMWGSRVVIYPSFNLGEYNYGDMRYRFVMEYIKQFLIFWGIYFVHFYFQYRKQNEAKNIKTAQLQEQLTRVRLQTLQSQLNPHFLFNTLNMISSTMYDDVNSADKMLADLSDLLRISLKNSDEGLIELKSEIEIVHLYFGIMKERYKDKLEVTYKIEDEINRCLVPKFLFQPLAENSIKHGAENLSSLKIEIIAKKENEKIVLIVKDNGPGIDDSKNEAKQHGIGVSNTLERLGKLYESNYSFEMENTNPAGLKVIVKIPYQIKT